MQNTRSFEAKLRIAGQNVWPLSSPVPKVVLRHERVGQGVSSIWKREFDLANADYDYVVDAERAIQEVLYPVEFDSRLWLEDQEGKKIDGPKAKEPPEKLPLLVWERTRVTDNETGELVTYQPSGEPVFKHAIQIRWGPNGERMRMEIEAREWPPALFLVGNNEAFIRPLNSLNESSIRSLVGEVDAMAERTKVYEEAGLFIAPAAPQFTI
jgi:hypothetical protein